MDENNMDENNMLSFDSPKEQSSYIKVIGVGGGGGNAVNYMYREGIKGVDFIVCNTDQKALNTSPVPNKITLGHLGLGAGNKPEKAKRAAEEQAEEIRQALSHNTQMLFITAGMGGGTGTGAAPVIAEIAKSIDLEDEDTKKILVVAIVTTPFSFEGPIRRRQAEAGINELRKYVDSILIINNDKLRSFGNLHLTEAFIRSNSVLHTAAKGIAEIITGNGLVNIDFQDVNTVMEHSGTSLMGAGSGKGENRAMDAIEEASTSVLLNDNNIAGAQNMLLYFSYSSEHEITMDEISNITDYLCNITGDAGTNVIWGAGVDDTLDDELRITLIATGFEQNKNKSQEEASLSEPVKIALPDPVEAPSEPTAKEAPIVEPMLEPVRVIENSPEPKLPINNIPVEETKHIFVLEPDVQETQNIVSRVAPTMLNEDPTMQMTLVHGSDNMETSKPQETNHTHTAPIQTPVVETAPDSLSANFVSNRADRIRIMHDMLRNNPNGPQIVENMTTRQLAEEPVYETPASNMSDAPQSVVTSGGKIKSANSFLYCVPD